MAIKYNGENALTFLLTLINSKFKTKVDKVDGKGLSTNDFTTALLNKLNGIAEGANKYTHPTQAMGAKTSGLYKVTIDGSGHITAVTEVVKADITALGIPGQDTTYVVATSALDGLLSKEDKAKLDGIAKNANNYTHPSYTAKSSGFYKITVDATGHVSAVSAVTKADITNLGIPGSVPTISTDIEADATSNAKTASPKAVKTYVDGKISSTYKPGGSIAFADLPALTAANSGMVYNLTDNFTTTASFVEGAGNTYPAGTNVAIVYTTGGYKYDVLAGFVDLSDYAKTADFVEFTNEEVQAIWDSVFAS